MDSGNSGSMQSSSGGDEEYESRADSFTAAFMNNPPSHVGPMAANFHPQSSSAAAMFDPLSNFFDPLSTRSSLPLSNPNPNPLLNLDMVWSRNLRSDQGQADLGGLPPNSSAANQNLTGQLSGFSGVQNIPQPSESNALRGSVMGTNQTDQNINNSGGGGGGGNPNAVRNSKKRPRASRRAPTTVLTTDTTNFRAMVQEFTGIPAPPFTASSPFPRNSRFDLFGTAASSTIRSATHLDGSSPQPFLLRPFPQKPPFLSPPSSTNDLGLLKHPSNFLNTNMQNHQLFNIQNMFQSNQKYPSSNSAITDQSNKQQGSSNLEIPQNDQNLKMGFLEEFGLSHGHTGTQLTGLPLADETLSSTRENNSNPPPANWVGDGAESEHGGLNLRSGNGNNYSNSERVSNGKLRYSATANSSEFLGDKAAENVTARSEGMVESWICSSD